MNYDIIIGAGPAGLSFALSFANRIPPIKDAIRNKLTETSSRSGLLLPFMRSR
jgi:2-polyprenyl-6-methoxyphenol hydroxylase-like FAD-dependent oxidoreductase